MTVTRRQAFHQTRQALEQANLQNSALDARLLLFKACAITHEDFVMADDVVLTLEEERDLTSLTKRRGSLEPMAYILGVQEFYGRDFLVSPAVLIPRPDTEVLVEKAITFAKGRIGKTTVLDLGTGSGAILLTVLAETKKTSGLAVDISKDALAIARENAERLDLGARTRFLLSNWADAIDESFDLIVSNPPYITQEDMAGLMIDVRDFEPESALVGGPDGLDPLRLIARDLPRLLKPGGLFLAEIGKGQAKDATAILADVGLQPDKPVPDLNGIERCVVAWR